MLRERRPAAQTAGVVARTAGVVAAALIVATMSACSTIEAGEVVDKEFEPSHSWVQMMCSSYSSKGICTVWVPITHQVPDSWSLELRQGERAGSVRVSEAQYESCGIADQYPACARSEGDLR